MVDDSMEDSVLQSSATPSLSSSCHQKKRQRETSTPSGKPCEKRMPARTSRRSLFQRSTNMSTPPIDNPSQPNFSLGSPTLPTDPSQSGDTTGLSNQAADVANEAQVVKDLLEQVHNTTLDFPSIDTLIAQSTRVLTTVLAALGLSSRSKNSKLPKIREILGYAVTHLQGVYQIFSIPPPSTRYPNKH